MNAYDIAQVCPNGHVANDATQKQPIHNKEYCPRCGERTTTVCLKCNASIPGRYLVEGVVYAPSHYKLPAFCQYCGRPYPWTSRKQRAAIELFMAEVEDKKDQEEFRRSVKQITEDTPQAQAASGQLVKLLKKVGNATADTIREFLIELASDAVKKMLIPGG